MYGSAYTAADNATPRGTFAFTKVNGNVLDAKPPMRMGNVSTSLHTAEGTIWCRLPRSEKSAPALKESEKETAARKVRRSKECPLCGERSANAQRTCKKCNYEFYRPRETRSSPNKKPRIEPKCDDSMKFTVSTYLSKNGGSKEKQKEITFEYLRKIERYPPGLHGKLRRNFMEKLKDSDCDCVLCPETPIVFDFDSDSDSG